MCHYRDKRSLCISVTPPPDLATVTCSLPWPEFSRHADDHWPSGMTPETIGGPCLVSPLLISRWEGLYCNIRRTSPSSGDSDLQPSMDRLHETRRRSLATRRDSSKRKRPATMLRLPIIEIRVVVFIAMVRSYLFEYHIYLYAPFTLDEWHTWFQLHGPLRAVVVGKKAKKKNQNENICPTGIELNMKE